MKLLGGGPGGNGGGGLQLVCGRPTLALSSALVPQTLTCFGLRGRFLAHKCIVSETEKSKLNLRYNKHGNS